jgi:hypothetical protein
MSTKTCNTCKKDLPLSCFTKHPQAADGYQPKCRHCRKAYDAGRYESVRDKQIASARAWNLANPEKAREAVRKADAKRRGAKNASRKQYDEMLVQATPKWADLDAIRMFYEVADVLSRGGVKFHVDHLVPIRGKEVRGLHVQDNLRVIPAFLNLKKGNRLQSAIL